MGVNKIAQFDLPFPLTHYVKVDHARFDVDSWESQVMPIARSGARMLLWDAFRDGDTTQDIHGVGDMVNTTWVQRCKKHHYYAADSDKAPQSWHLPEMCTAVSSISIMAQWAVLLGFDEIYLLGCDGGYKDGHDDHCVDDYYKTVDPDYAARNNLNWNHVHKIIKRSCPIPIYNATVGGSLEIYPRVNIYDLKGN